MVTSGKRRAEEQNLETGTNLEDQGCRGPPAEQQHVKAVPVQHCAATTVPCNCCPNCYAEQSHKDNVRSYAAGNKRMVETTYLRMLLMTLTEGSSEGCLPGLLTGVTPSAWNPTLDAEITMNATVSVTVFLY